MHTILVIDDDKDIDFIASAILQKEGYNVLTALSPYHVCDIIKDNNVDLLLMDVNLQGYDGRDVCRSLKTDDGIKIPIILFSAAKHNFQTVQHYLADGFISKPFELEELRQEVLSKLNNI